MTRTLFDNEFDLKLEKIKKEIIQENNSIPLITIQKLNDNYDLHVALGKEVDQNILNIIQAKINKFLQSEYKYNGHNVKVSDYPSEYLISCSYYLKK